MKTSARRVRDRSEGCVLSTLGAMACHSDLPRGEGELDVARVGLHELAGYAVAEAGVRRHAVKARVAASPRRFMNALERLRWG